mgnify:FL=1
MEEDEERVKRRGWVKVRAQDRDKETTDSFRLYWSGMELIELHPLTLRLSRTDKKGSAVCSKWQMGTSD